MTEAIKRTGSLPEQIMESYAQIGGWTEVHKKQKGKAFKFIKRVAAVDGARFASSVAHILNEYDKIKGDNFDLKQENIRLQQKLDLVLEGADSE
jgi:hypothetical protein